MKNKLSLNMLIDLALLIFTAALSFTGFIIEVVLPSHYAIRHEGVEPWLRELGGLGRHGWGDIHLWIGIIWAILLTAHIVLHLKMIKAFVNKQFNSPLKIQLLTFLVFLLITITIIPWFYFIIAY